MLPRVIIITPVKGIDDTVIVCVEYRELAKNSRLSVINLSLFPEREHRDHQASAHAETR